MLNSMVKRWKDPQAWDGGTALDHKGGPLCVYTQRQRWACHRRREDGGTTSAKGELKILYCSLEGGGGFISRAQCSTRNAAPGWKGRDAECLEGAWPSETGCRLPSSRFIKEPICVFLIITVSVVICCSSPRKLTWKTCGNEGNGLGQRSKTRLTWRNSYS